MPSVPDRPQDLISHVHRLGDDERHRWDDYLKLRPEASVYHRYAWRSLLQDVFNLETYYLAASVNGEIAAVLPLVRQKSLFFGDFLVSLPFFNYGGVVYDRPEARDAIVEAARLLSLDLGAQHVELRHCQDMGLELPARTDKISMLLDLPNSPEALLGSLKAKVRSQIKRPQREGIVSRSGGAELVPQFYRVFARNMRDLGTPVYPPRFFAQLMRRFEKEARIFVAEMGGKTVAAALVLGNGERLEIPWASSLREANPYGVNMFLYWEVLQWAIQQGYRSFDFGRCTKDSGTYRFKRQWGAEPLQLHWHYLLNAEERLPMLNHSNPRYHTMINLWTRQPVWLANAVSPLIAKHLP